MNVNYHKAVCRLCREIMLFPKEHYTEEQLICYECNNCKYKLKSIWKYVEPSTEELAATKNKINYS